MFFALICKDKPGHLQMRLDTRPAHLAHLERLNREGCLKFAGPFLDDEGKPEGSLVVLETADRESAKRLADEDPYAVAGLFDSVEIRTWNWVFNAPANA